MAIDAFFRTFPHLETNDLILRRVLSTDAPAVFDILSDPLVTRHYDDDPFTHLSQARELIAFWSTGFERSQRIRWGIARREGDILIGTCGYYGIHPWHMRASLGYELARPFWRQGIMSAALSAIIEFGFDHASLNRVQADVMLENHASINLLRKLGFKNEGILRQYERWESKGYIDLYRFSLLKKEYRASSASSGS